jgi:hypothetical protein
MTTPRMALPKLTIGLHLGDRFTQLCALDARGQILATERLRTTPAAIGRHFAGYTCARGLCSRSARTRPGRAACSSASGTRCWSPTRGSCGSFMAATARAIA